MARQTEDRTPIRTPPLTELLGTALPTADDAGRVGGIRLRTREDVLANLPTGVNLERELAPGGSLDLLGKLFELTPFPAQTRLHGNKGSKQYEYKDDEEYGADVAATTPLIGLAAGPVARGGLGIKRLVKGLVSGPPKVESEAQRGLREAAEILRTTPEDAAKRLTPPTDDIAEDIIPGFRKSAEDKVLERGGRGAPPPEAPRGPNVEPPKPDDPYELGIRLEKLGISEDARNLVRRNALEDKAAAGTDIAFEAQRRGVQSLKETDTKARIIAENLDISKTVRTKAGTAFNAEEQRAIRKAVAQKAQELDVLNTEIQKVGRENASPDQKLAALKVALELNGLQRVAAGARTEAGRALRALAEVDNALRSKTEQSYDKAFKAIGGRADAEHKIARLQDIWTDTSRTAEARERDVFNFVKNLDRAGNWRKIEEFWLNSILSNPITHEINIIGNALLLTAERLPTRIAAATIEELVTIHGTRRTKAVTFTDTAVGAVATFTAIKKAAQKSLMYAKTGVSDVDVNKFREAGTIGRTQALESGPGPLTRALQNRGVPIPNVPGAGGILNLPTRALGVEDAFFYTLAQESEAASLAARQVLREGLSLFSGRGLRRLAELKATDEIQEAAQKSADLITLKTKPDKITQAVLDLRRVVPGAPLVLPFVQTPANLLKRGWDYSPLGITNLFRKGLSQEDKALAMGRIAVGSGVMAYFMTKALEGEITGPAPSDSKARQMFYDSGKRPFSMKVNGAWVEWGRFDPFATPIRWATALKDVYDTNGGKVDQNTIGPMLAVMGRAFIDTTYMSGMSNFINALEDPHGAGERTLARIASGYVPFSGFLRGLAGTQDPYLRDPEDLLERIESGLPGASALVSPTYNILGEPVTRPPSRQGAGALINPIVAEDRAPHPVIAEDVRLAEVFGKKSLDGSAEYTGISRPSESISGVKLTSEQQERHEQIVGQARKKVLNDLLTSVEYNRASDVQKLELWKKASDEAAKSGRKALGLEVAIGGDPNGAKIAFANSTTNYGKAETVALLQKQGALTPSAVAAIEADNDPGDLTVAQYLHGYELRSTWDKAPAFTFGTPGQWDAAARAAEQYKKLIKGLTAAERKADANITRFFYEAAGGALQTFYETDGSRKTKLVHPTRIAIEKDRLWDRFRPS